MQVHVRLIGVALIAAAAGCSSGENEPAGAVAAALTNGQPAGIPDLLGVAALSVPPAGCTATLIGPRTIIMAAHCALPFSQGCQAFTPDLDLINVVFADEQGNPVGPGAQTVRVLGLSWHPLAYGNRVTNCPNPPPPLPSCPGQPGTQFQGPSCAFTLSCLPQGGRMALHFENDVAIGYLASAPVGIDPIPVIAGTAFADPSKGLVAFPGINDWLDGQPIVTQVGYGGGSTPWPAPGGGTFGGRDAGSARAFARNATIDRNDTCGSNVQVLVNRPMLHVDAPNPQNVWVAGGDSGGPTLLGPGQVASGMDPPTALPPSSGLAPRRYLASVNSLDADYVDPSTGTTIQAGLNAMTFDAGNGTWLLTRIDDIDGDGVPNEADNCVGIANSDQANCNVDAEIERQGEEMGDACDPVACPQVKAPLQGELVVDFKGDECGGISTIRRLRTQVTPVPGGSSNPINGVVVAQSNIRTAFRFCQKDADIGSTCSQTDGQRRESHFYIVAVAPPVNPWLPMSFAGLTLGADAFYNYPSMQTPLDWAYWSNRSTWVGNGWITDPGTPTKPPNVSEAAWKTSSKLDGVLGAHAGTNSFPPSTDLLGTTYQPSNGVHPTPNLGDGFGEGAGLARNYVNLAPDAVTQQLVIDKCLTCPAPCLPFDVFKKLRWCPHCARPSLWWKGIDPTDGLLAPTSSGGWGLVDSEGRVVPVDEILGTTFRNKLADPTLRYVAAAEPYAGLGATSTGFVQGVFVNSDGTDMDSFVAVNVQGSFQVQQRVIPAGVTAAAPLSPRHGYVPVYSRILDAVLIVGGRHDSTGALTREVWALPAHAPGGAGVHQKLIFPGYEPEVVLAATVASADAALWVLDEVGGGLVKKARLARVDPTSGRHEVVWQGPRLRFFDDFYLAVDRDGQVLLFGSSNKINKHFTVRFEANPFELGTARPVLIRFEHGQLAGEPLVDAAGYLYVTERGKKRRLHVTQLAQLTAKPGAFVDLGACF